MGGVLIGCSGSVAPPAPRSVLPAGHGVKCLGHSPTGIGCAWDCHFPTQPPPTSPGQGPRNQNRGLICRAGPYKELPVHRELSHVAPSPFSLGARISRDRHLPRQGPALPVAPPPAMQSIWVGSPAPIPTLRRCLSLPGWTGHPWDAPEMLQEFVLGPVGRWLIQEPPDTM